MLLEEIDFKLTGESLIAYWGDDLYLRCKNLKNDIETNLVVSGSCTSVCNSAGTKLLYMLKYFKSLKNSL